ncbi:hypothetical protein [Phocaeicola sp.]
MKRDIISIEDKTVIVTGNDVWMTAAEIADLFNVGGAQVNNAIKKILKNDVLKDYEVYKYIHLNEKCSVDVYNMEVIIPLSFQWDTYYTNVFRKWLVQKTFSEKKEKQPIFIQCGKGYIC